jgi:probable selenium-dependent hydroxylase accessory protein YqeC
MGAGVPEAGEPFALRLGLEPGWTVAAIGGGGKMTLLDRLAGEWAAAGGRPLLVATTRIVAFDAPPGVRRIMLPADLDEWTSRLGSRIEPGEIVLLGRDSPRGAQVLEGLGDREIEAAAGRLGADLVLVKADGARGQPLKAHREHEPPVPRRADAVLAVAGMSAWGEPLGDRTVHHAELFSERWGYGLGEPIDDRCYEMALGDPEGYRRAVPARARYLVFLNQATDERRAAAAERIARALAARGAAAYWGDVHRGEIHGPAVAERPAASRLRDLGAL